MVNKFAVDRVPVLMQFLGIPPYPEDIIDAALNIKDADLVDHYSNMDAVMEAVSDNQVQLQHQILKRAQQQKKKNANNNNNNNNNKQTTTTTTSTASTPTSSPQKSLQRGASNTSINHHSKIHSNSSNSASSNSLKSGNNNINNSSSNGGDREDLVEVDSDTDEERDDSVAVL
jgi:glycyl-tRNA synthetase beta subunit